MKIKQHLMITDTAAFFKGDYSYCFSLVSKPEYSPDGWVDTGEIEISVSDDMVDKSHSSALESLDKQESEVKEKYHEAINYIEQSRAELLCLTDQSAA